MTTAEIVSALRLIDAQNALSAETEYALEGFGFITTDQPVEYEAGTVVGAVITGRYAPAVRSDDQQFADLATALAWGDEVR